ncbi:anti-phage dCTP deaminase [Sphingomonas sp. Leaf17]|uniref:anti-phage dCTP deaminase n=1 Tax=Sphingomonas sp. Leaf17 TaxID=1735683 RepID=UPI000A88BE9E|nr:anti-phage dCTP deaminase [Sphingomonas sp. Leaf17]
MASTVPKTAPANDTKTTSATEIVKQLASHEMIFGVVGPVGSGTSEVAEALHKFLKDNGYDANIYKARDVITEWANASEFNIIGDGKMDCTRALQDAGDELRRKTGENSAVAVRLIRKIVEHRAKATSVEMVTGRAVEPDSAPRAYILDSLRNPGEVELLRRVYQQAFCLIGVVCDDETRKSRLTQKFSDAGRDKIEEFMQRDEKAAVKYGQQVSATFHLSEFFLDNSVSRLKTLVGGKEVPNPDWNVTDELGRLTDILSHTKIYRPRTNETAMYHAFGARMRSACLSRQVGAALMDGKGSLLATGTNEVPRAGGGVYGSEFGQVSDDDINPDADHRCAFHGGYCRNTMEQNSIVSELVNALEGFGLKNSPDVRNKIKSTRLGQIIEFSRAVHAEMDALLSAARQGVSTIGSRLFVTTYPCHNCARHIVAAGVDEVQFIEPYLKSRALPLHGDSITTVKKDWMAPSKISTYDNNKGHDVSPLVLFRPFTGVAPRLYRRAFYKDRELKNESTGVMFENFPEADGSGVAQALQVSYAQVEAKITESIGETGGE